LKKRLEKTNFLALAKESITKWPAVLTNQWGALRQGERTIRATDWQDTKEKDGGTEAKPKQRGLIKKGEKQASRKKRAHKSSTRPKKKEFGGSR